MSDYPLVAPRVFRDVTGGHATYSKWSYAPPSCAVLEPVLLIGAGYANLPQLF